MSTEAKPFLKWAGGKGQLLTQLDEHLPSELQGQEFTYIEPFVGGGAMLFYMLRKFPNITHAVINDINPHLVTAYRIIKEQPDELIRRLSALEHDYFSQSDEEAKKAYFLHVRKVFNETVLDDVDRTKYLMFLNRTCFNGLYRVNSKGKFNVPFGRNLHPTICNTDTILADSELLNRVDVTILNGDFERTGRNSTTMSRFVCVISVLASMNIPTSCGCSAILIALPRILMTLSLRPFMIPSTSIASMPLALLMRIQRSVEN